MLKRQRTTIRDVLLAVAIGLALGAIAGHESFYAEPPDTTDEREQRRQAAIDECRERYGFNAIVTPTKEGHLRCRRGGPIT